MRISDWSSDVCSSDLRCQRPSDPRAYWVRPLTQPPGPRSTGTSSVDETVMRLRSGSIVQRKWPPAVARAVAADAGFAASVGAAISAWASGRVRNRIAATRISAAPPQPAIFALRGFPWLWQSRPAPAPAAPGTDEGRGGEEGDRQG